jgi:iron complex outermembrane receptor protein
MKALQFLSVFLFICVNFAFSQGDTITLNEVEIRNFRNDNVPYLSDYLPQFKIEQAASSDIGNILRKLPNVSGIKKGATGIDPVVRGFKYSQLNVLIDGAVKIEGGCPNRMDPAAAHVDINDLLEINVLKGPYALKYGPSFGGVINLVTWRPIFYKKYQTHVNVFAGLQSNGGGYKSNIELYGGGNRFTYQIAAGTRKYDDYRDGNDRVVKASLRSYYAKANVGIRISENHILDAGVDGSFGRNIDFPALAMDEREDNTIIYKLNYFGSNIGNSVNFIRIRSWFSDVNHSMDNKNRPFSDTVVVVSVINAKDAGIRGAVNIDAGKGTLEAGFDYEHIYKDGNRMKTMIRQPGLPVKKEIIWSNAVINNLGLYTEYRITHNKTDWVATARLDFNKAGSDPMFRAGVGDKPVFENNDTKSSSINFSFNGGGTYHINEDNHFSFSMGRGVRSADISERFITLLPVGYDHYDYLGNPQLKPEVNYEVDINFEHISKHTCSLRPGVFFSYVTNFIGSQRVPPSVVRPQTKGVLGVKQFVNFNHVWLAGMEISWTSPKNRPWHIDLNIAYTYGVNPEATGYKIENGQVVDEYTIKNDALPEIPPFEFNGDFRYGFFKNKLIPMLSWRVVLAQKHISESYGEQESKAFQTVDFKLKYQFNTYLTVWGGVNNLFNTTYYEHLNRNIIGSSMPLYEPGRNFFVNLIIKF